MFSRLVHGLVVGTVFIVALEPAMAGCVGVPASADTLSNFQNNPSAWLAKEASRSLASDIQSIAVAASSNPDSGAAVGERFSKFGNALHTMLTAATGPQGQTLGRALGMQAGGCGKTADDVEFLTALQTAVVGTSADTAYGLTLREVQTSAVGAGGGGTGVGGQTGGSSGATGGIYSGSNTGGTGTGNFSTPTQAPNFSANALGTGNIISARTNTSTSSQTGSNGTGGANGSNTGSTSTGNSDTSAQAQTSGANTSDTGNSAASGSNGTGASGQTGSAGGTSGSSTSTTASGFLLVVAEPGTGGIAITSQ